jgi:hypothetical protein
MEMAKESSPLQERSNVTKDAVIFNFTEVFEPIENATCDGAGRREIIRTELIERRSDYCNDYLYSSKQRLRRIWKF